MHYNIPWICAIAIVLMIFGIMISPANAKKKMDLRCLNIQRELSEVACEEWFGSWRVRCAVFLFVNTRTYFFKTHFMSHNTLGTAWRNDWLHYNVNHNGSSICLQVLQFFCNVISFKYGYTKKTKMCFCFRRITLLRVQNLNAASDSMTEELRPPETKSIARNQLNT